MSLLEKIQNNTKRISRKAALLYDKKDELTGKGKRK